MTIQTHKRLTQFKTVLMILALLASLILPVLPAEKAFADNYTAGTYQATVNIPIRSGPGTSYKQIGTVAKGKTVNVTSITNQKWAKTSVSGKTGYFSLLNTKKTSSSSSSSSGSSGSSSYKAGTYVLKSAMTVRKGPGTEYAALGTLSSGTTIKVSAVKNTKWGKITFNKQTAYVSLKYAQIKENPANIPKLLAKTKIGKNTSQIITVTPNSGKKYYVKFWQKTGGVWKEVSSCSTSEGYVGKNGLSSNRSEGDKTTPIGCYRLTQAFGQAADPGVKMKGDDQDGYIKTTKKSYWGGTGSGWGKYKNHYHLGKLASGGENIGSSGYSKAYKYAMNIGFNYDKPVNGKGSCIFLHCHSGNPYTAGCVAVPEKVMKSILKKVTKKPYIIIVKSQSDITKY